jgi:hypothetical protein
MDIPMPLALVTPAFTIVLLLSQNQVPKFAAKAASCQALQPPKPLIYWLVTVASMVAVPAQEGVVMAQAKNKLKNKILKNSRNIKTIPFQEKAATPLKEFGFEPR